MRKNEAQISRARGPRVQSVQEINEALGKTPSRPAQRWSSWKVRWLLPHTAWLDSHTFLLPCIRQSDHLFCACLFHALPEFLYAMAAFNLAYPITPWRFKLSCLPDKMDDSSLLPTGISNNDSGLSGENEAALEARFNSSGTDIADLSQATFHCCFWSEQDKNCTVRVDRPEGEALVSTADFSAFQQPGKYFSVLKQ